MALSCASIGQAQVLPSSYRAASGPFSVSRQAPDILRLEGEIGAEDAAAFSAALTPEVETVLVNSVGGEVSTALDIAELIERRGLRVAVSSVCASSCANYLFAAAQRRVVLPGGLLLWHGGVTDEGAAQIEAQLRAIGARQKWSAARTAEMIARETTKARSWRARQDRLYARRKLEPAVLHRLNELATDAEPVAGGPRRDAKFMVIAPEALRCAGFATESFWTLPAGQAAWRDFFQATGLSASGVTRSQALERSLCASK